MVQPGLIDCDLHVTPASVEVLFPYLAPHWQEYIRESAFKGPVDFAYPKNAPLTVQPALRSQPGAVPGTTLAQVRQQALDPWGTTYAILQCDYPIQTVHNPDLAAALARAVNDWLIEEWLAKDPRLRAALVVPIQVVELAVREVERVGDHPGFVQVYLPARSEAPYGHRRYWPLYEAAVRHRLAIGIHYGGAPGHPPTPTGWPSYFLEEYVAMALVAQSQLLSLVSEGVFDRFPELKVVVLECGWSWLPAFLWRFDKDWKGLRREVPWVRQPPSAYIRAHCRFSLQPPDVPSEPRGLAQVLDHLETDDLLLFATDYPHWHFDQPAAALPAGLPAALRPKILWENAWRWYQFTGRFAPAGGEGPW